MKKLSEKELNKLREIAVKMGVTLDELTKDKEPKALLEMIDKYDNKKFGLLNE